jgi:hypothetical protein
MSARADAMSTLTIQAETRATERLWPVAIPLAAGLALWAAIFHAEIVAMARQLGCPVSDSKDVRSLREVTMAHAALSDKGCVARGVTLQALR